MQDAVLSDTARLLLLQPACWVNGQQSPLERAAFESWLGTKPDSADLGEAEIEGVQRPLPSCLLHWEVGGDSEECDYSLDNHWLEGVEGLQHDFPDRS
jgi:hypothetical protein